MIEVKLNDSTYMLPENWGEVSLKKFIELSQITEKQKTKNSVKILSVLLGIDESILYNIDVAGFNKMMNTVYFLNNLEPQESEQKEFMLNGKKYVLKENFNSLTVGEMVDIELAQEMFKENNNQESFSKILAVLLREDGITDYDSNRAAELEQIILEYMNAQDAINVVTFFLTGMLNYMSNIKDFMQETQMKTGKKKNKKL